MTTADVDGEYEKNPDLKQQDVKNLRSWMEKQPHLPSVTDLQLILFLQSCYFSVEQAKHTIDAFFTLKAHSPEIFHGLNTDNANTALDVIAFVPLPHPTPEGNKIIFVKFVNTDVSKFFLVEQLKALHMSVMLWLSQEGTSDGHIIIFDMDGVTFMHILKLKPLLVKQFCYYLEKAIPWRMKKFHIFNSVSMADTLLAFLKPLVNSEFFDMLQIHQDIDGLLKYIPRRCLPGDYGGEVDTIENLNEKLKKNISANVPYFQFEEQQMIDESKRVGKSSLVSEGLFGIEGSFKQLEID